MTTIILKTLTTILKMKPKTLHDPEDLNRLVLPKLTKRELYALIAMHALLSIPPDQRPKSVVKASVHAADMLLNELVEKK